MKWTDWLKGNRWKSWIGDLLIRRLKFSHSLLRLNHLLVSPSTVSWCGGGSCLGDSCGPAHCSMTLVAVCERYICDIYLDNLIMSRTWHGWSRRWRCALGCNGSHRWRSCRSRWSWNRERSKTNLSWAAGSTGVRGTDRGALCKFQSTVDDYRISDSPRQNLVF